MYTRSLLLPAFLGTVNYVVAQSPFQQAIEAAGDVRIWTKTQNSGIPTFARLPLKNCLDENDSAEASYDIAILGAPYDLGVTGRPGERSGPLGIRLGSQRLGGYSIFTGEKALDSWAEIVDCGDAPLMLLDKQAAFKQLGAVHKQISSRRARSANISPIPRLLTLGGDHSTTLPALRSTFQHWGQVSVLHFDSHLDTWDPRVIGGGVSLDAGINHGTWLHVAHEEGLIGNSSMHVGIRGPTMSAKADLENDVRCGFEIINARDIDIIGIEAIVNQIKATIGGNPVYISVDIDVLDPAFAPATGTPEPGGYSTREFLTILDSLRGLKVIGADVVEVAPVYDNTAETTVLVAAQIGLSLISLMVDTPVKP